MICSSVHPISDKRLAISVIIVPSFRNGFVTTTFLPAGFPRHVMCSIFWETGAMSCVICTEHAARDRNTFSNRRRTQGPRPHQVRERGPWCIENVYLRTVLMGAVLYEWTIMTKAKGRFCPHPFCLCRGSQSPSWLKPDVLSKESGSLRNPHASAQSPCHR